MIIIFENHFQFPNLISRPLPPFSFYCRSLLRTGIKCCSLLIVTTLVIQNFPMFIRIFWSHFYPCWSCNPVLKNNMGNHREYINSIIHKIKQNNLINIIQSSFFLCGSHCSSSRTKVSLRAPNRTISILKVAFELLKLLPEHGGVDDDCH